MADKFAANDLVFAKLKGFPPWPAKIMERAGGTGKDEKYRIMFYGTHDEATVKWDQIFLYTADTRAKYGKPMRKSHFKEAMIEIDADAAAAAAAKGGNDKEEEAEEQGAEMAPEGLLEIKPSDQERSINEIPSTFCRHPLPLQQLYQHLQLLRHQILVNLALKLLAEVVARLNPSGLQMTTFRRQAESEDATLLDKSEDSEVPSKSKVGTPSKAKPTASEDGNSKGPSNIKVLPKRAVSTGNKQSLEPTVPKTPTTPVRKSERQTRSNSVDEKEEVAATLPESSSRVPDLDESEVDKENSNGEQPDPEATVVNNSDENKFAKPRPPKDPPHVPERKIRISTKNGLKIEVSFDAKNPDSRNDDENKAWQAIATQNVRKVIEDLKEGDAESQDIINSAAECIPSLTVVETKSREKLSSQLKLLRLEGEVIEIIGEIVGCLGVHSADCIRAIDLMDRLEEHKLNPLMLKKHPEVVHTIQKLRSYVGNVEIWGFNTAQREEFAIYAEEIRRKAVSIFNHFQELFGIDSSETFAEIFQEEVRKFKDQVDQFSLKKMLGLTEENGELRELAMDLNGDVECDLDTQ
ncbi:Hepatoma-derived growth factor-related protein 2 [Folsomia candida]|uniref:Hepatoma-derived growth factor-related protein 2 n=1 Tax=Folsomia candida TaxID=158441 RepID=A0A226E3G9_FOLCA|nr:Hepatoma-derived growth factor-related protein 2 [Folsomia candida]